MPRLISTNRPLWTDEFSVHTPEDEFVLRRQFTKFLVLTSFGMLVGNIWIWVKSLFVRHRAAFPETVVGSAADLHAGDVKLFSYPGPNDPCILVRTPSGRLAAYSQKCTHLSCAVYYAREANRLECPCHEGFFSIEDGRVLQGPPPRPLPKIEIAQRGDQLVAIRVIAGEEGR